MEPSRILLSNFPDLYGAGIRILKVEILYVRRRSIHLNLDLILVSYLQTYLSWHASMSMFLISFVSSCTATLACELRLAALNNEPSLDCALLCHKNGSYGTLGLDHIPLSCDVSPLVTV